MPQFVNSERFGVNIDRVLWYQVQDDNSLKVYFGKESSVNIEAEDAEPFLSAIRAAAAKQETPYWKPESGV